MRNWLEWLVQRLSGQDGGTQQGQEGTTNVDYEVDLAEIERRQREAQARLRVIQAQHTLHTYRHRQYQQRDEGRD